MKSSIGIIAAVSVALMSSGALASDIYGKGESLKDGTASASGVNWTGFYAGIHGGWSDWSFERPDDKTSPSQDIEGYFGGAQLGYDIQLPGGIVIGAVADAAIGDLASDTYKDGTYLTVNSEIDAFGTVRGRIGYSLGRFLPYVTGGAAWMAGSTTENCPAGALGGHCKSAGEYSETDNFSRWGLAYGGGIEMKVFGNVTAFAEYLRLDFDAEKHDLGAKSWDREIEIDDIDVIRAGLNYRF